MKLTRGDVIEVFGDCFLRDVDPGRYIIWNITYANGKPVYSLKKYRGVRVTARHYADSVDFWIAENEQQQRNLNRIEILREPAN